MLAIDSLTKDHHLTKDRSWPLIDGVGTRMKSGEKLSLWSLAGIVAFLDGFVLEYHMPKEDALLDLARDHGLDREVPLISKIIMEHEEVKNYVANLSEALQGTTQGNSTARSAFADNASEFISFFVRHETEEEDDLFPVMERVLTEAESLILLEKFSAIEANLEEDPYGRYSRLLDQLETELVL